MPCLSPFKQFVEDLFEAYDASGPLTDLENFINDNSELIIAGSAPFGIYNSEEYCCPNCLGTTGDACGQIYFLGETTEFLELAEFKSWIANPGSVPCCYNFMGSFNALLPVQSSLCWASIPRCCSEFENCLKSFETSLPEESYSFLIYKGVVEYGSINDSDNICFLKDYLDERYDDPEKTYSYISGIINGGLVIVCSVSAIPDEIWVLNNNTYMSWCSGLPA
jgi:hypothetical protein